MLLLILLSLYGLQADQSSFFPSCNHKKKLEIPDITEEYISFLVKNPEEQKKREQFFINLLFHDPLYYNEIMRFLTSYNFLETHATQRHPACNWSYKKTLIDAIKSYVIKHHSNWSILTCEEQSQIIKENFMTIISLLYPLLFVRECPACACHYGRSAQRTIRNQFENAIEKFLSHILCTTTHTIHLITFADAYLMTTLRSIRNIDQNNINRIFISSIDKTYNLEKNKSYIKNFPIITHGLKTIFNYLGFSPNQSPCSFYPTVQSFKEQVRGDSKNTTYLIIGIDLEGTLARHHRTLEDFLELCKHLPQADIIVATKPKKSLASDTSSFIVTQDRQAVVNIFNDYINAYHS